MFVQANVKGVSSVTLNQKQRSCKKINLIEWTKAKRLRLPSFGTEHVSSSSYLIILKDVINLNKAATSKTVDVLMKSESMYFRAQQKAQLIGTLVKFKQKDAPS